MQFRMLNTRSLLWGFQSRLCRDALRQSKCSPKVFQVRGIISVAVPSNRQLLSCAAFPLASSGDHWSSSNNRLGLLRKGQLLSSSAAASAALENQPASDGGVLLDDASAVEETLEAMTAASSASKWDWLYDDTPVVWIQSAVQHLHTDLNLPWWAAISLFAVSVSTCCIPLKMLYLRKSKDLFGGYRGRVNSMFEVPRSILYTDSHIHLFGLVARLVIATGYVMAIHGMTKTGAAFGLQEAGFLFGYIDDLTQPDRFLVPLVCGAAWTLSSKQYGCAIRHPQSEKLFTPLLEGVCVSLIATQVSAALAIYWCTSNLYSAAFYSLARFNQDKKERQLAEEMQARATRSKQYKKL